MLATFSVPEAERARRHTLRSRLSWLGFGNVAPGVWMAPAHLTDETTEVLARLGLLHYVDLFAARPVAVGRPAGRGRAVVDLDQIQDSYAAYVRRWRPVAAAGHAGAASKRSRRSPTTSKR